jgi:tripeptide aminopeptidase
LILYWSGFLASDVADLFLKLVSIPSPSGKEARVAGYIKSELDKAGLDSYLDDTGDKNDGDSGNLIVKVKGSGKTVMFVAHMDTVETGERAVKPVLKKGVVHSDGTTVLGADNKASVAALISALCAVSGRKGLPNVIAVFSVREEEGRMGVNYLNVSKDVDYAFVLDGSSHPGTFIDKALGCAVFEVEIKGREAHAGKEPEKGRNAIKAACSIIDSLWIGRKQNGDTVNIGSISGGTFVNVVPAKATFTGETRSFKHGSMIKELHRIEGIVKAHCARYGCSYKFVVGEMVPPFATGRNSALFRLARTAAKEAGLQFACNPLYATCEANILAKQKFDVIGANRGGTSPHSVSESVSIEELSQCRDLILSIIKHANDA